MKISLSHYSPFGSCIQELQYAYADAGDTSKYRFGFNNQEQDKELGEYYAFEYRMHDARLGRFLSVDPLSMEYPWNSTYAFAENDIVQCVDLEGAERVSATYRMANENGVIIFKVTVFVDYSSSGAFSSEMIYEDLLGKKITTKSGNAVDNFWLRRDIVQSDSRNHPVRETSIGRNKFIYTSVQSSAPGSFHNKTCASIDLEHFAFKKPFVPIVFTRTGVTLTTTSRTLPVVSSSMSARFNPCCETGTDPKNWFRKATTIMNPDEAKAEIDNFVKKLPVGTTSINVEVGTNWLKGDPIGSGKTSIDLVVGRGETVANYLKLKGFDVKISYKYEVDFAFKLSNTGGGGKVFTTTTTPVTGDFQYNADGTTTQIGVTTASGPTTVSSTSNTGKEGTSTTWNP